MKKILAILIFYISIPISKLIKKNDKYIIFGAWLGDAYLDNTKYLFEYMINKKEYKLIWVGNTLIENDVPKEENIIFCKKNSLKLIYYIFKSKYVIVSHSLTDITKLPLFFNHIKILTDHGIPIKKWGLDDQRFISKRIKKDNFITKIYKKITEEERKYNYFISSSRLNDKCICTAEKHWGASEKTLIKSGTPRNDFLFNLTNYEKDQLKIKYSKKLGFNKDKKVILYAPTFRRTGSEIESLIYRKDVNEEKYLEIILKKYNAVLIEKNHFATNKQKKNNKNINYNETLIKINEKEKVNIQEILAFTDILISDYSGVFLDYLIMDKPIINFMFDYDYYKNIDSGLYYEIDEFAPGEVSYTFKETCIALEKILSGKDNHSEKRLEVRRKFLEYEKGDSCKKIFNKIFLNIDA